MSDPPRGPLAISACVMACNDEATLGDCLQSLAFCREIVVVLDTKSGDRSGEIAHEHATRVVEHCYAGDLEQKRFTTGLATEGWVLSIDGDEAKGVVYVILYRHDGDPERKISPISGAEMLGEYRDRFVRTAAGWRFAERNTLAAFSSAA